MFADLRGGLAKKKGLVFMTWGCDPNAHYELEESFY